MGGLKIMLAVSLLLVLSGGCSEDDSIGTSDPPAAPVHAPEPAPAVGDEGDGDEFGFDQYEFRFEDGSSWRGEDGDVVEVVFTENGAEQRMSGTVVKVDGSAPYRLLVVRGDIAGGSAVKAIFESDLVSMTSPTDADEVRATGRRHADGYLEADKPGVFLLPWEGTVGVKARHNEIEAIAEEADKYGPGQIIVLEIDSPGGLVMEGDLIHEALMEIKKRHRVVAWIRKAISAAAFTALHCHQIYFTEGGAMGSAVMFAGQAAIAGPQLEAWVKDFGDVAEEGGRSRIPAECMVTHSRMASYDKDPETDKVTWYPDMRGEFNISDDTQVLTMNAENALHSNYINGIADTVEELAVHLDLPEWHEINDEGRKIHRRWIDTIDACERDMKRILRDLQIKPEDQHLRIYERWLFWYGRVGELVMQVEFQSPPEDELRRAIERMRRERARQRRR